MLLLWSTLSFIDKMFILIFYRNRFLFKPKSGQIIKENSFYRRLYPEIIQDIEVLSLLLLLFLKPLFHMKEVD